MINDKPRYLIYGETKIIPFHRKELAELFLRQLTQYTKDSYSIIDLINYDWDKNEMGI